MTPQVYDMIARTSIERISHLTTKALPYFEDHDAMILYDMDVLRDRVEGLIEAFPDDTIHAIAMKANPLDEALKFFKGYNLGLEVASSAEMYIASANDFPGNKIVYNSPAKTRREIAYALEQGYQINADSFHELERIAEIYREEYERRQEAFDCLAFAIYYAGYGPDNYSVFARVFDGLNS